MAARPFESRIPDGIPLAYLITFRTYGTWLPGDSRGTVDAQHNDYDTPMIGAIPGRAREATRRMRSPPRLLSPAQREVAARTVAEVCTHRAWKLWECSARTNHVHVVVSAESKPEPIMNSLKSWTTRRLTEAGLIVRGSDVWERHGSTRYLWDQTALEGAIRYVRDMQELPSAPSKPSEPRP